MASIVNREGRSCRVSPKPCTATQQNVVLVNSVQGTTYESMCHRSFLVLWLAALPFIFAPEMHWWAVGVCVLIGYQLLGFEEIGVEIESPFGTDDVRCCPQPHLHAPEP